MMVIGNFRSSSLKMPVVSHGSHQVMVEELPTQFPPMRHMMKKFTSHELESRVRCESGMIQKGCMFLAHDTKEQHRIEHYEV